MSISILPIAKIATGAHGRRKLFRLVLFLLGGVLAAFALKVPARAAESRTLIIPPNDGYGFEECLKGRSQCGLGPADEAAGTMDEASRSRIEPGSFHVTCGDRVN